MELSGKDGNEEGMEKELRGWRTEAARRGRKGEGRRRGRIGNVEVVEEQRAFPH